MKAHLNHYLIAKGTPITSPHFLSVFFYPRARRKYLNCAPPSSHLTVEYGRGDGHEALLRPHRARSAEMECVTGP